MGTAPAWEGLAFLPPGLPAGLIGRLHCESADGTPEGLPICAAAALSRSGMSEVGFGKGLTRDEAITGAIGEALEIYAGSSYRVDELLYESFARLDGNAIDPRLLCLYDAAYYDRPGFPYTRFDPDRPVHWARGYWLDTGEAVWLPALTLYHYFPAPLKERFCQVTSNGSATGCGVIDATIRATLELVERDAFMLTWYCRIPATSIVIDEEFNDGLSKILDSVRSRGARVTLYLLQAGVDVPTVLCVARGDGEYWPGATLGLGTHPDPRIALKKAILEMGQTGFSLCRCLIDGSEPVPAEPQDVRTFRQHALYYLPKSRAAELDFLDADGGAVRLSELDCASLESMPEKLRNAGTRIAIMNLTTPDLRATPFSVVRALGINLQQVHCGFGLDRTDNPRLRALLSGPINAGIPPFC